ncbi:hypothetical protein MTO96_049024 [Rhipicephalus appendiculatus]
MAGAPQGDHRGIARRFPQHEKLDALHGLGAARTLLFLRVPAAGRSRGPAHHAASTQTNLQATLCQRGTGLAFFSVSLCDCSPPQRHRSQVAPEDTVLFAGASKVPFKVYASN